MKSITRRTFLQTCTIAVAASSVRIGPDSGFLPAGYRKIAVIGVNRWSSAIATQLLTTESAQVVAWIDPYSQRFNLPGVGRAKRVSITNAPRFDTWDQARTEIRDCDLAIIAVPQFLRASLCRDVVSSGRDVLVCPPVAMDPKELRDLNRSLADMPNRRLHISAPHRHDLGLEARHKEQGRPSSISIEFSEPMPSIGPLPQGAADLVRLATGPQDMGAASLPASALKYVYHDWRGFNLTGHGCWSGPLWSALDLGSLLGGFQPDARIFSLGAATRRYPTFRSVGLTPDRELVTMQSSSGSTLSLNYHRSAQFTATTGLMRIVTGRHTDILGFDDRRGWTTMTNRNLHPLNIPTMRLRDCETTHRLAFAATTARCS